MPLRYTREEIKEFLARLGFSELNEEELTEFIKDLRKLIKYEESKRRRRRLGHDSEPTAATFYDTSAFSESHSLSSFLSNPEPLFESSRFDAEGSSQLSDGTPTTSKRRGYSKVPSAFANLLGLEEKQGKKAGKGKKENRDGQGKELSEDARDYGKDENQSENKNKRDEQPEDNSPKKDKHQKQGKKHSKNAPSTSAYVDNPKDTDLENASRRNKNGLKGKERSEQDKITSKESQVLFEFEDSEDDPDEIKRKSAPSGNKRISRTPKDPARPKTSIDQNKKPFQNTREEIEKLKLANRQKELDEQLAHLVGNDIRRSQKKRSDQNEKGEDLGENAKEKKHGGRGKLQNLDLDDQINALFAKDTGREENKELIDMITQALVSEFSSSNSSTDGSDTSSLCQKKKSIPELPMYVRKDPVSLYHYYKRIWDKQKVPGENKHLKLRWNVRAETMGKYPCNENGKRIDYLTRNGIPLLQKIYQPPRFASLAQPKYIYRCVPSSIPAGCGC